MTVSQRFKRFAIPSRVPLLFSPRMAQVTAAETSTRNGNGVHVRALLTYGISPVDSCLDCMARDVTLPTRIYLANRSQPYENNSPLRLILEGLVKKDYIFVTDTVLEVACCWTALWATNVLQILKLRPKILQASRHRASYMHSYNVIRKLHETGRTVYLSHR